MSFFRAAAGLEADGRLRLDLDGLARLRITAEPGLPLADAPRAEADEGHAVALLQRRRDAVREGLDRGGCGGARDAGIRRNFSDQFVSVKLSPPFCRGVLARSMCRAPLGRYARITAAQRRRRQEKKRRSMRRNPTWERVSEHSMPTILSRSGRTISSMRSSRGTERATIAPDRSVR